MARDPKEWAADVDCYDVINVYSSDEFEVNREGLADLIREAQEDGAAEWKAHAAEIGESVALMTTEIAALKILLDVKTTKIDKLKARLSATVSSPEHGIHKCITCETGVDREATGMVQCTECIANGDLPIF